MMKKFWTVFLLSLLLAACGRPAEQPAVTADTSPAASAAPTISSTVALAQTELPTATASVPTAAGCTLQTILEPANPTEVSLFPPVTADEQQLGPPDAATTIVEYGDFQ